LIKRTNIAILAVTPDFRIPDRAAYRPAWNASRASCGRHVDPDEAPAETAAANFARRTGLIAAD